MAPKKGSKKTPSAKIPEPVLPDEEHSECPLPPLALGDDAKMALLPWLARGFAPTRTSGQGKLCGLNALWRAFRDARDAMKVPGSAKIRHITQAQFKAFLSSTEYNAKVQEVLDSEVYAFFSDEQKEELREELTKKEYLDIVSTSSLKVPQCLQV
jgi:hypothetical protein